MNVACNLIHLSVNWRTPFSYVGFILFLLFIFSLRAIANSECCNFLVKWNMNSFEGHSFPILSMQKNIDFLVTIGKLT